MTTGCSCGVNSDDKSRKSCTPLWNAILDNIRCTIIAVLVRPSNFESSIELRSDERFVHRTLIRGTIRPLNFDPRNDSSSELPFDARFVHRTSIRGTIRSSNCDPRLDLPIELRIVNRTSSPPSNFTPTFDNDKEHSAIWLAGHQPQTPPGYPLHGKRVGSADRAV